MADQYGMMAKQTFDPQCNLMVNFIPESFTDNDLKQMFTIVGSVKNCKVMTDKLTRKSLGYGFVEFYTASDAQTAIQKFHSTALDGKVLRVDLASAGGRKPITDSGNNSNVYLSGLPLSMTDEKLKEMFSVFGKISNCRVMSNNASMTTKIGFVLYDNKSEAAMAISEMNGKMLPDASAPLIAKFAIPSDKKRTRGPEHIAATNLGSYAGGQHMLTPLLSAQSNVVAPVLVNGCSVTPASGHVSAVTGEVSSLYVHGLTHDATEQTLYELFSPFGAILNVKPVCDMQREGTPCKGFGFVNFRNRDEAAHAIVAMHNYHYQGKLLQVKFKDEAQAQVNAAPGIPQHSYHQGPVNGRYEQNELQVMRPQILQPSRPGPYGAPKQWRPYEKF